MSRWVLARLGLLPLPVCCCSRQRTRRLWASFCSRWVCRTVRTFPLRTSGHWSTSRPSRCLVLHTKRRTSSAAACCNEWWWPLRPSQGQRWGRCFSSTEENLGHRWTILLYRKHYTSALSFLSEFWTKYVSQSLNHQAQILLCPAEVLKVWSCYSLV